MPAGFLEGGLDPPAADEPAQDVHRAGIQVGAQEGLWLFLTLWIAAQHPADRHLHAGVMPERSAGGDVEPALASAIPAIDPDPAPGCGGIGQPPPQARGGSALLPGGLGRRAPLTRGRPSVPGFGGGAGSYRPASSRSREIMHRCRPPSRKSSMAEKLLSPTAITRRPGSQRTVCSSPCRAQSVSFLCR